MDDFDEDKKITLETVMAKVHQEIGETLTKMSQEVSDIPNFTSRFLQNDLVELFDSIYNKFESLSYDDLIERAKPLAKQAEDIWLEKGYRFGAALMTAREHKECGSSGYGQFMVLPDTVVQIANKSLKLIEKEKTMTLEEIRKARILNGMATIDDTGTVTGEIVPIIDSYHFLSEERETEVKELEQKIVSELKGIVAEAVERKADTLTKYKSVVRSLADGRLTRAGGYSKLNELNIITTEVADEAIKMAYRDGCKDNILTPMEIVLLGREIDERYREHPYTPLGLQKQLFSVDELTETRTQERFFDVETDVFSGYLYPVALSLEPLNAEGETERGPLVLTYDTKEPIDDRLIDMWKASVRTISFSRPTDWYHKPADSLPLQQE